MSDDETTPQTSGATSAGSASVGAAPVGTGAATAGRADPELGVGGFVGTVETQPAGGGAGGPGGSGGGNAGGGSGGGARRAKKHNFFRRHLALTSLAVIVILILGTAGGFVLYLNHLVGNFPKFPVAGLHKEGGVNGSGSVAGHPVNILVLGADNGTSSDTVSKELSDGHWTPGSHRSDTIMVVHIPKNRKTVQVVSIPRDSWVQVPGFPGDVNGYAKINAAFSWGGPSLAVKVVENLTHIPLNHVVIMDWSGLMGLTNALGGVKVYIPQTFYDDSQHITWHQGWQTLNGKEALAYVRTRHGLVNGDFGRIDRQQNFMRAVMSQLLSAGTFANPVKLVHVVGSLSHFIEVDNTLSSGDIRSLALSLRHVNTSDVQYATAPLGSYAVVAGQDIVRLNMPKTHNLFVDLDHGNIEPFLKANPNSRLPGKMGVH